jgi:LmbE family N-acetylglucosaminyl deacetylase
MPQRAVVGSAHYNDATASTAAGKRKKKPRGGRKVRQRRNREAAEAAAAVGASTMHSASACAGVLRLGLYAELKAWERQQAREHKLAVSQQDA